MGPATRTPLRAHHRKDVATARRDRWLDRIVAQMPRAASPEVDSFLATLELALLDGVLARHERDQLVQVAEQSGLGRDQVLSLHEHYLGAMAETALADGVVTEEEHTQMRDVAAMLGLSDADVAAALEHAAREMAAQGSGDAAAAPSRRTGLAHAGIALRPGARVVVTGAMKRERSEWERIARTHGLVPGGVTKTIAVVVATDPDSLSGKAAKARSNGIPIVTEAAFATLLQGAVDSGELPGGH